MLRVMIFIDGDSLRHSLLKEYNLAPHYPIIRLLDLEGFCKALCGSEQHLVRSYYYYYGTSGVDARTIEYKESQKFHDYLTRTPSMEVKRYSASFQKSIDIPVVTDLLGQCGERQLRHRHPRHPQRRFCLRDGRGQGFWAQRRGCLDWRAHLISQSAQRRRCGDDTATFLLRQPLARTLKARGGAACDPSALITDG